MKAAELHILNQFSESHPPNPAILKIRPIQGFIWTFQLILQMEKNVAKWGCMLIYGITGIHVPVIMEVYVFETAWHQKHLADFINFNTKFKAMV